MSKKRITAQQRRIVTKRAQGCCEYCLSQVDFATQSFSVEHIIPTSQGGKDTLDNLALACQGCNGYKYTKTKASDPVDGTRVPFYNPRQQRWQDHFRWNENFTIIIGLTPIGRATIEALKMNRGSLIRLRSVLYALGEHPPTYLDKSK